MADSITGVSSLQPIVDMDAASLGVKFIFRARANGVFDWVCPFCGQFTRSGIRPSSYTLRCQGVNCRRTFGLGHVLYVIPPGPKSVPDDYLIPYPGGTRDAFPLGEVAAADAKQLYHRVVLPLV